MTITTTALAALANDERYQQLRRQDAIVWSYRESLGELLQQLLASSLSLTAKSQAVHSALGILPEPVRSVHRDALLAGAAWFDKNWNQEGWRPDTDQLLIALKAAVDAVESAMRGAFGGAA